MCQRVQPVSRTEEKAMTKKPPKPTKQAKSAMGDGNISQSLKKHVQASKALPIKPGRDNNT